MPAKTAAPTIRTKPPKTGTRPASPAPIPKLRPQRPLPVTSVQNAAKAFKHFSASRFPKGATPSTYVPHAQARVPTAVATVQRKAMAQHLARLAAQPQSAGLTVALPVAVMRQLLPSFNVDAGTVNLTELLGVLRQRMQGTDFYASGDPTLTRVVRDSTLLSQVQAYIKAIKTGGA